MTQGTSGWDNWLYGLKQKGLRHVTVTEASERLGLAPRAGYLTRLCRKGKIPEAYLSSGVWLIPVHWVLGEAQKKGFFSPQTGTLPFIPPEKDKWVNQSKIDLANINLLLLEMEEIVEQMEGASEIR